MLSARPSQAYSISTLATAGCHEMITTDALRAVRSQLGTAAPLPASRDDRALIDDLPFSLAADMNDLGGATLLIGVRDNDLAGLDGDDLSRLAFLHGDPKLQQRHCLHESHVAEPNGSPEALDACRTFILQHVDQALDGLDAAGNPDPTLRTTLPLYLALRHSVNASLPTYYVRIGQAIHAVEDSFAHTYRTPDGTHVTAVVNWIDEVDEDLNEKVDGPPHSTEMDRCDDPDELRRSRRALATQAATAMLQLTLDPTQSRAQKMAAVSALLDQIFSYAPGCTADNAWCDAPERKLAIYDVFGCSLGDSRRGDWGSGLALAIVVALALRVRRRKTTIATLCALCILVPGRALAAPSAGAGLVTTAVPHATEPSPPEPLHPAFGFYAGVTGSVNDAALAVAVGGRLRASRHWAFGIDAEWNPWLDIDGSTRLRAGTFNLYGSGIFRIPLDDDKQLGLRITASLGGSRTLLDLYGVPKGTTGLFLGLSPLGVEWKVSRLFQLVINPLGIAVPVPQLGGIPFWYPQYRASIGLELYPGRMPHVDSGTAARSEPIFTAAAVHGAGTHRLSETAHDDPPSTTVATESMPRSAYRLSFNLDAPLLLIGGAVASSFLFLDETAPPFCAPLCDRSQVNAFDRPFAGIYHPAWTSVGDIAMAATLLLPPIGVIIGEPTRGGLGDLLVVGEAALLTSAIQVMATYAVARPRPRVYGETAPLDQRDDANAARSFFSGHVANALSVTMVSTTALLRMRHRTLAWTVLAVGLTGSALVGVARIAAGGHFPSDVLVGYAVGAGVGIALPALHALNLQVTPIGDAQTRGLAIAARF